MSVEVGGPEEEAGGAEEACGEVDGGDVTRLPGLDPPDELYASAARLGSSYAAMGWVAHSLDNERDASPVVGPWRGAWLVGWDLRERLLIEARSVDRTA